MNDKRTVQLIGAIDSIYSTLSQQKKHETLTAALLRAVTLVRLSNRELKAKTSDLKIMEDRAKNIFKEHSGLTIDSDDAVDAVFGEDGIGKSHQLITITKENGLNQIIQVSQPDQQKYCGLLHGVIPIIYDEYEEKLLENLGNTLPLVAALRVFTTNDTTKQIEEDLLTDITTD